MVIFIGHNMLKDECGTVSVDIRMNADRTTPMSEGTSPWYKTSRRLNPMKARTLRRQWLPSIDRIKRGKVL
jgi:hypothetical protein